VTLREVRLTATPTLGRLAATPTFRRAERPRRIEATFLVILVIMVIVVEQTVNSAG